MKTKRQDRANPIQPDIILIVMQANNIEALALVKNYKFLFSYLIFLILSYSGLFTIYLSTSQKRENR